jgi:hypothetical protein
MLMVGALTGCLLAPGSAMMHANAQGGCGDCSAPNTTALRFQNRTEHLSEAPGCNNTLVRIMACNRAACRHTGI